MDSQVLTNPKVGDLVINAGMTYRVTEVNCINKTVRVRDDQQNRDMGFHHYDLFTLKRSAGPAVTDW